MKIIRDLLVLTVGLPFVLLIALTPIVAAQLVFKNYSCEAYGERININTEYSVFTQCLVEYEPGKLAPLDWHRINYPYEEN